MILITADLHGDIDFRKINNDSVKAACQGEFPSYMLVAGDFGVPFSNNPNDRTDFYMQRFYEAKPYDVVVIPGNHENYNRIEALPVETYHGAKARRFGKNIVFIEKNQILELEGKTFYCFGGADSTDIEFRTLFLDYFPQEQATYADFLEMQEVLQKVQKVDYIIAHTAPTEIVERMHRDDRLNDSTSKVLDYLVKHIEFEKFFYGHMHRDFHYERYQCIYDKPVVLG
jgi:predicted phosphodiesterase